jgi:hypothetical protein
LIYTITPTPDGLEAGFAALRPHLKEWVTPYTRHFECPCGETWADTWCCDCDDRCPSCDTSCSPQESEEGVAFILEPNDDCPICGWPHD